MSLAMRGIAVLLACAGLAVLAPGASPHSGHGPTQVAIGEFAFAPKDAQVFQGDSVVFTWKGPDTDHSATGDEFDSDPGRQPAHAAGDTYSVTFSKVGTFSYHCKVHPFMTGTVTVQELPPAPPQPALTAPVLSKVRVKPRTFARRTRVSFNLDWPAIVRATLRRRSKVVKQIQFSSPPGDHRRTLDFGRKLRSGTYVLRLVAVDSGNGMTSRPVNVAVEVRR
jgi:plastocyanin